MFDKKIEDSVKKINEFTTSDGDAFQFLQNFCHDFFIDYISLAIFLGKENLTESFLLYDTLPEWHDHYKDKSYHLCDPIFSSLKKVALPFEWDTKDFKNLFPLQQKLMEEAYSFGIKSGITIPLIPNPTFQGFLTIFNQAPLHMDILYLLSLVANICTQRIIKKKEDTFLNSLTEKETYILFQKSQGLTIKEISHNLKISSSTAAFHLTNVRKKLQVKSTEHAVSKFIAFSNYSMESAIKTFPNTNTDREICVKNLI